VSVSDLNRYFKYADDAYLIVPYSNASTIPAEIAHHSSWAANCNLKLNPSKTLEIVFSRKRLLSPPPNPSVTRTETLKILGITVDNKLTFSEHVKSTVTSCSQSLYALRLLRQHGMLETSMTVFRVTLISKLLYASHSGWGFTSSAVRSQIEAFLRRSKQLCYCNKDCPDSESLADSAVVVLEC